MDTRESSKALSQAVSELDATREAAKLKVHLLSMDARRTWDEVEGSFLSLKKSLAQQGEKAAESSATAARDLARSLRKFVEEHL
jgi:hypothetical protein